MPENFTPSDIEKMRRMVQNYDNEHKPVAIHDLNNPPKVPYRYQPFPKTVYDHQASEPAHEETRSAIVGSSVIESTVHVKAHVASKVVHSQKELDHALTEGWVLNPPEFREEPENDLSEKYQEEVQGIENQLAAVRRGPGRPRKEA